MLLRRDACQRTFFFAGFFVVFVVVFLGGGLHVYPTVFGTLVCLWALANCPFQSVKCFTMSNLSNFRIPSCKNPVTNGLFETLVVASRISKHSNFSG